MKFDLSCIDVPKFLEGLGVENVRTDMKEARFSCPYPAHSFGDKNPSAYMNLETTAFICFSCGARGNAISFLADLKGVSRTQAKEWIIEIWAPQFANISNLRRFVEDLWERSNTEEKSSEEIFKPLDEIEAMKRKLDWTSIDLDSEVVYPGWVYYMLVERDFSNGILNKFEVGYDRYSDRPCILVRNRDGDLVGFKGRAWRQDQIPKYLVLGDTERSLQYRGVVYGFSPYDASKYLFGCHLAEPKDGEIILCEGELNVISLHEMGYTNSVAPSGSTLGERQIEDLLSICERVILLFDTDATSLQAYTTARAKITRAIDAIEAAGGTVRICGDHRGDPAEMSRNSVGQLISNALSSTVYRVTRASLETSLQLAQ